MPSTPVDSDAPTDADKSAAAKIVKNAIFIGILLSGQFSVIVDHVSQDAHE